MTGRIATRLQHGKPPMTFVQPETFTLTDAEAAAVQAANMAQQMKVAGTTPVTKYGSIAVPIILVGIIAAIDWIWWDWTMPPSLFVTMMLLFVAGMATQTIGYWLNLQASKRRILERTRQVFEPRTVRLTDEGLRAGSAATALGPCLERNRPGRAASRHHPGLGRQPAGVGDPRAGFRLAAGGAGVRRCVPHARRLAGLKPIAAAPRRPCPCSPSWDRPRAAA